MIKDLKYFFNRTLEELEILHQNGIKSIWCGKEIDTHVAICDIKKRSNNGLFVLMENVLSTNNLLIYYELMGHLKSILQDKYNIHLHFLQYKLGVFLHFLQDKMKNIGKTSMLI